MSYGENLELLHGTVMAVHVNENATAVDVHFYDNRRVRLDLEADCCSETYFADPEQFNELVNATIVKAEGVYSIDDDRATHEILKGEAITQYGEGRQEVTDWGFLIITTDRGHVTIDWRNDSNGYYSGWITAKELPPAPLADPGGA